MRPIPFGSKLDFIWFELWHHEGRRARHGASMMGPDYTQWHGMYEVAKRFYVEMVPELEELVHRYKNDSDPQKAKAAAALEKKLDEVLNSTDHRWYLNKMPPEEVAARKKATEDFKKRYEGN